MLTTASYLFRHFLGQASQSAGESTDQHGKIDELEIERKVNEYLCSRKCQYDVDDVEYFINRETTFTATDTQETIEKKLCLSDLKEKLMSETRTTLTELDEHIVERLWATIVLNRWLEEAVSAFKRLMGICRDIDIIQEQLMEMQTKNFWSINILQHHVLHKIVNENKGMFEEENLKICLESYSNQCLSLLLEQNNTITNELRFLEEFMRLLKESADKSFITSYREIFTVPKMNCEAQFRCLLVKVIDDNSEKQLTEIAQSLRKETNFFLATQFFDIVSRFFVPMKVKIYKLDGIVIVQVTGSSYSLSDVWNCDPKTFENTEGLKIENADEVHLISHLSIDLDVDFNRSGVNLVIKTVRLKCSPDVVIDVSGESAQHNSYDSNAGTNDQGKDGRDGYAGNSAGNVLIEVDYCESYPMVLANGSNGTKGQDGGNGTDGHDGKGMTTTQLKESFGPAANFGAGYRHFSVQKIIKNINDKLDTVIIAWWTGEDANTWNGVWENMKARKNGTFLGLQRYTFYRDCSIYLRVKLNNGLILTFAFEAGGHFKWTNCQSYLLVEGTDGTMGTDGGKPGRGGRGGFAGSISFNQEVKSGKPGQDGSNGKPGKNGTNGKNGWDIGWLDYSVSNAFGADKWPKYYGEDHNTKLNLEPYVNSNNNRIFCPYRSYKKYDACMMEMSSKTIENPKQRETTAQCTKQANIEHHAVPTRKSNVRADVVREQFLDMFSAIEQMMSSLRKTHKSTCEATRQRVELEQHQKQVRTDLAINRQVEFSEAGYKPKQSIDSLVLNFNITPPLWQSGRQKLLLKLFNVLSKIQLSKEVINKLCSIEQCPFKCDDKYLQPTETTSVEFRRFIAFYKATESHDYKKFYKELRKKKPIPSLRVLREFILHNGTENSDKMFVEPFLEYQKWLKREANNLIVFQESMTSIDKKYASNKAMIKKLEEHLKTEPLLPPSYPHIELFAQMSEINIQLFHENDFGERNLHKDFNPGATKKIRAFIGQDGQVHQLKHNYIHFKMERERWQFSSMVESVLSKLLRCTTTQELDNYERRNHFMHSKPFGSLNYVPFAAEIDVAKAIANVKAIIPDDSFPVSRLQFITKPYIGSNIIIKALRDRLCAEGGRISSTELGFIINTIIQLSQTTAYFENILLWMITASDQRNWYVECALLQFENYFQCSFNKADDMTLTLMNVEDKEVTFLLIDLLHQTEKMTVPQLTSILRLLQKTTKASTLRGLTLVEWPYVLKVGYWTERVQKIVEWRKEEELEQISLYLPTLEAVFSESLLGQLIDIFEERKSNLTTTIVIKMFQSFYSEQCFLNDDFLRLLRSHSTDEWLNKLVINNGTEARTLSVLTNIINNNCKMSAALKEKLSTVSEVVTRTQIHAKSFSAYSETDIKKWCTNYNSSKNSLEEIVAVIDRAIFLKEGFYLRDTQKLAIVTFFVGSKDNRVLEQVSTGEGKSLIVVSVAIIKALKEERVDVITSSSVLARRDAEVNKALFGMFNLSVCHNCSESLTERITAYRSDIVYGEVSNFQRDYLLDRFYGKNIFGNRNFQNLIVDEVDSMLLDKGNNILYLSHQIAAFDKLEIVFLYIWQLVNRPAKNQEDYDIALNTERIRQNVIDNLYKRLTRQELNLIYNEGSKLNLEELWKELVNKNIISEQGHLQVEKVDLAITKQLKSIDEKLKKRLIFLLNETIRKQCLAVVPNCLISFVEDHLERWIENAKNALLMTAGNDYVVDVDRTGMSSDLHANIIILDRDTGTDQASSQWEEGLHQFLQLKHGCKVSLMSLKAIFISNVSYFKLYCNLYGLTGTLGSQVEMDLLQQIHKVEYVTIPTSCGRRFVEEPPEIWGDEENWIKRISKEVQHYTKEKKRSVLIICETVESVNFVQKKLIENGIKNVFAYRREHEEFTVANKPLLSGQVIIATNLAGRGTDIKISKLLRDNGGLHICLTYLPTNKRVEEQAFGRAARSGDPGTGRLVIIGEQKGAMSGIQIINMKKARDCEEIKRVSDVKENYEIRILAEECCFEEFRKVYDKIKQLLNENNATSSRSVNILENLIDQWALWLDKRKQIIRNDDNAADYKAQLSSFVAQYGKYPIPSITFLMSHAITLGKTLVEEKDYSSAIGWFDYVIKKEPMFSEAAHYYKAYAIGKSFNWEFSNYSSVKQIKKELRIAKHMFERHSNTSLQCSATINKMKENFQLGGVVQISSYEEQKKSVVSMYEQFISSIDEAIGSAATIGSFITGTTDEYMSSMLYDTLLENNILTQIKPNTDVDVSRLEEVCLNYGIQCSLFTSFLDMMKEKTHDQNDIVELMSKHFGVPDRDEFWTELMNQKFLTNQKTYLIVEESALMEEFPSICTKEKLAEIRITDFKTRIHDSKTEVAKTVEQITEMKLEHTVIDRDDFRKVLKKRSHYEKLLRKNMVSEIEVADLNTSIKIYGFNKFDGLLKSDFDAEHIDPNEVEVILKELLDNKVIEASNKGYTLNGNVHTIHNLSLSKHLSLYEYSVRAILQRSFAYRLAFNRIQQQIEDNTWPLKIPLTHQPYQGFFWDLVEAEIIRPVSVNKNKKAKSVLDNLYTEYIPHEKLVRFLEDELPPYNADTMIKDWVKWGYLSEAIFSKTYAINDKTFTNYTSVEINQKLTKYLRSEMTLRKETTRSSVDAMVDHLKGFIAALEAPQPYLQLIYEALGSKYHTFVEEVNIFMLNGLGEIIRFKEKPWTIKMILNTSVVIVLGVCQIAIGLAIQLFSVGLMTNVGVGFISEGVGDLMFAVSALRSGYFSWSSYWQHKKESLMFTVVTCGMGALCSRGAQVSRYGAKLAEKTLEVGGKRVADMCGMELIKEFGWSTVGKKVLRDISMQTLKGVAFGLSSAEVTKFIENHLQSLCDGMASAFMIKLEQNTAKHEISQTIVKVYNHLGPKEGKQLIDSLTKAAMQDINFNNNCATTVLRFANQVSRGIKEGLQKNRTSAGSTTQDLLYIASYLGQAVDYGNRAASIIEMGSMTDRFLDELNGTILKHSSMTKKQRKELQGNADECEEFKKTSVNMIKEALQRQTGQIIAQKFVAPIMQAGANYLVTYVGKQIKKQYNSYRNSCHSDELKKEQEKYRQNAKKAGEQDPSENASHAVDEEHQKNMTGLKDKVRDQKLYAEIIRDGGHMDSVCLKACGVDLDEKLKAAGNTKGYVIILHGEKGVTDRCECGNMSNAEVINVKLTGTHFELLDSSLQPISKPNSGYNCMFESLQGCIPELDGITPDEFRENIANRIERDSNIGYSIQRGLHSASLQRGLYGGKKAPPRPLGITETSRKLDFENENYAFNKAFDVNLRSEDGTPKSTSYNDDDSREQLKKAYEKAEQKLNECLQAYKDNDALRASLGKMENINAVDVKNCIEKFMSGATAPNEKIIDGVDFKAVRWVEKIDPNGKKIHVPVEWEATKTLEIPLSQSGKKHSTSFEFKLNINVDNPGRDENGPQAPHVGFSCQVTHKPAGCTGFRTISGHIMVNNMPDLPGRTKFGMKTRDEVRQEHGSFVVDHNWLAAGTTKYKMRRSNSLSE